MSETEGVAKEPLRAVVIGVRGMGKSQAKILGKMPEYKLLAVCDINAEVANACAQECGVPAYTSSGEMLAALRPDVVAVCTNNTTHAKLTIEAAEAGVKGIYCEKPMATNLADGRAMVEACESRGIPLVINHQRRLDADLVDARKLIESGAIGDLVEIRGSCAGDVLSDGTHLVDSLLWLAGDADPKWIAGQIAREDYPPEPPPGAVSNTGNDKVRTGFRFGHVVEDAGWGMVQLTNNVRLHLYCGDYRNAPAYQDYEIIGTKGRMWRVGDQLRPNLFIQDANGGDLESSKDETLWHPYPRPTESGKGQWRAVPRSFALEGGAIAEGYRRFERTIRHGEVHPMNGRVALRGFEIVMGLYEAARTGRKLTFPIQQERFPLEVMLEEARA